MGFWADFIEAPWTKEIRLLTTKVQQLENLNQIYADMNKKLTSDLNKTRTDLRQSEQSEVTLRSLKGLIEAELDAKDRLLALVEKGLGTDVEEKVQGEIDELLEERAQAQSLGRKHQLSQIENTPPLSKRRKMAKRA
ncbi:hypothetical protein UCRNP2_3962 [Neofusicoccum parvum UCRNP2]|uniref:Uncharacterized protein n=1 Tax=Botryosphaeria parva (strain UCR-NP2) TaxID=1287680 RepID=R1ENZ8_BOTPV|nr:hypothetical protein UCRNP2_3962 [Neofusicoccum parvum UCRNP2]